MMTGQVVPERRSMVGLIQCKALEYAFTQKNSAEEVRLPLRYRQSLGEKPSVRN